MKNVWFSGSRLRVHHNNWFAIHRTTPGKHWGWHHWADESLSYVGYFGGEVRFT